EGAGEQRKAQRLHHKIRIDAGERDRHQQQRHDDEAKALVAHRALGDRRVGVVATASIGVGVALDLSHRLGPGSHLMSPAPSNLPASPAEPAPSIRTPRYWMPQDKNTWSVPQPPRARSR